jgi:hypothetical protein
MLSLSTSLESCPHPALQGHIPPSTRPCKPHLYCLRLLLLVLLLEVSPVVGWLLLLSLLGLARHLLGRR